jgi:predicted ATPase
MSRGSRERANLRFTRLQLENWRNFSHVEVDLPQRVFVVGPNASGKSNLLDAFRFLHDVASIGGGLAEAVRKRQGVSKLRALAARRFPDIAITVDLSAADGSTWRYHLAFGHDKQQRPVVRREAVERNSQPLFTRPDESSGDLSDPERLTQTYLQQVNANQDFRPVADAFACIRYLHIVPQLIREPDRSVGRTSDPYGGDFLEQVAATREQTRRAHLKAISDALKVAVPQLSELELKRDHRGVPHLQGRYEHWRPQGAWQTEDQFSDGTLRLLGLLWATLEGGGPLLLEEPELSLHPGVVRFLPQMFARVQRRSGRQMIVSTHSSELLEDEGIGLDEVLLLMPSQNGTQVRTAASFPEIEALLHGGSTLSEAVITLTMPPTAHQLALFGD